MPFSRPNLGELQQDVQQDYNSLIDEADSRLQQGFLYAMAMTDAGLTHELYGWLVWLSLQLFTATSEDEFLEAEAKNFGITRQAATAATGTALVTGSTGTNVPVNRILQRADGVQYRVTADTLISAGTANVPITCTTLGIVGNSPLNTQLTFISPIGGVQAQATSSILAGGNEIETTERLRARLDERKKKPPQGGSEDDYPIWAKQLPGVTRVWPDFNGAGVNTVIVRFAMDNTYPNGIPTSADATALQALLKTKKPATTEVYAVAPVAEPVNFNIQLNPNNASTQAAVQAEVADMMRRDATPGGTLAFSRIREAISIAAGERNHRMVSPTDDVTASGPNNILVPGTFTFSSL